MSARVERPGGVQVGSAEGWLTNQHYDLDPAVFELFLDPTLKYSSGLYERETDSLEQAQRQKLAFVAAQLGLRGGERVLDVGCGWGSLVLYVAGELGCRVTGVTPSERQAALVRERARERGLEPQVEVVVGAFEEIRLEARSYDAVALLGSIVHMADRRQVLRECYRLCRHRARLYLSESCFRSLERHRMFANRPDTRFVQTEIFGAGDMVPLSVLVEAAESAGFSLTGLTDLTEHYRRTIEDWRRNVERSADRLDRIEPGLADRFRRWLEITNAGWGFTTKHYALQCVKAR